MFATIYRKDLELLGVDTNNLVERSFLDIKQKFLERNKVYNVIQLIQQISIKYENYSNIKLIDCINNRKGYIYKEYKQMNRQILKNICKFIMESNFSIKDMPLENNEPIIIEPEFDNDRHQIDFESNLLNFGPDEFDFNPGNFEPDLPNFDPSFLKSEPVDFEPDLPSTENNKTPNEILSDDEPLDIENYNKAMQIMSELKDKNENSKLINKWCKRLVNAKTDNQRMNVIATGGISNKNILKVQSRIAKSSHKNRFASMAMKASNSKPRSLANAIKNNTRNKLTQSKK